MTPTIAPVLISLTDPAAWKAVVSDAPRILSLYVTTLALACGVVAIVVPTAAILAVAMFRFRAPGVRVWMFLALAAAFTPLAVYAGTATIGVKLRAGTNQTTGVVTVPAKLRYQACDDDTCYPPKTIDVSIPLNIK